MSKDLNDELNAALKEIKLTLEEADAMQDKIIEDGLHEDAIANAATSLQNSFNNATSATLDGVVNTDDIGRALEEVVEELNKTPEPMTISKAEDDTLSWSEMSAIVSPLIEAHENADTILKDLLDKIKTEISNLENAYDVQAKAAVQKFTETLVNGEAMLKGSDKFNAQLISFDTALDISDLANIANNRITGYQKAREQKKALTDKYGTDMKDAEAQIKKINDQIDELEEDKETVIANFKKDTNIEYSYWDHNDDVRRLRLFDNNELEQIKPGVALMRKHPDFSKNSFKEHRVYVANVLKEFKIDFPALKTAIEKRKTTNTKLSEISHEQDKLRGQRGHIELDVRYFKDYTDVIKSTRVKDMHEDYKQSVKSFLNEKYKEMARFLMKVQPAQFQLLVNLQTQMEKMYKLIRPELKLDTNMRYNLENVKTMCDAMDARGMLTKNFAVFTQNEYETILFGKNMNTEKYTKSLSTHVSNIQKAINKALNYYQESTDNTNSIHQLIESNVITKAEGAHLTGEKKPVSIQENLESLNSILAQVPGQSVSFGYGPQGALLFKQRLRSSGYI